MLPKPFPPKRNCFFKPAILIKEIFSSDQTHFLNQPGLDSEDTDYLTMGTPEAKNVTFFGKIISIHGLTHFYGTDKNGTRDDYGTTIAEAIINRIGYPIADYWEHAHSYFFKPYDSVFDLAKGALSPIIATLLMLGLLEIFVNPLVITAVILAPALIELIAGIVSFNQAIYHKSKAVLTGDRAEHNKASEHLLDATARFLLIMPFLMICWTALPLEVARFFTRTVMSLVQLMRKPEPLPTNTDKPFQRIGRYIDKQVELISSNLNSECGPDSCQMS